MRPINEAELYEKAGVWIYSPDIEDVKTSHQQQAEYIYTYIREKLIEVLNKAPNTKIMHFYIPNELLGVDITLKNGNKMKSVLPPMRVHYSITNDEKVNMSAAIDDRLLLTINIPITKYNFKSILFHELKHCWQFVHERGKFKDEVYLNIDKKSNISIPVKKFIECVYRLDPREFSSYRENIYVYAYEKYIKWNNDKRLNRKTYKDKQELIKNIKRAYSYHTDFIPFLKNVSLQYNKDIHLYVLYLFLSSLPSYNGEPYYDLFSSKIYFNEIGKQLNQVLGETFKNISMPYNNVNCSKFLMKFTEDLYEKQELNDFVDILVKDIIENLKKYIGDYQHKINKVINLAFQDAEKYINRDADEINIHNSNIYNFVLFYKDNQYGIEVSFEYNNEKYIGIIKDESIRKCMTKMYILYRLYKNPVNNINIKFVYDLLINSANSYSYKQVTLNKLKMLKYPHFKNISDCEKIFNFINNIDVDKF